jgi:hypothetical protein
MAGGASDHLFTVHFTGHRNVLASNGMTLEVTKEDFLTLRGDCIVGIRADAACRDLDDRVRAELRRPDSRILFVMEVGGEQFRFEASGSSALSLEHPLSMVVRKSTYTCSRTLAIRSSAAARDLPRSMVSRLARGADGELRVYANRA